MDGRVTCNEEKCQQPLDRVQISTEAPTTISAPVVVASISSRINTETLGETGEKGLTGNAGPPGKFVTKQKLALMISWKQVK